VNAIEFNNVSKKFRKGEKFNSLRDSIPAFFSSAARGRLLKAREEREFWAVKDVSFQIKPGEVVGIMGPNGAGKSTILKLLSRIIVPNKGAMNIRGRLSALIEITAGFHPELTGRENVYLNGTILGMSKKEISKKFDQIVQFSGITEFIDTPVKRYSSGMYSRLGFSVASHLDPDILLVDEVLSVGDMAFQAQCGRKMRELLKSGTTIILVSHQLSLIYSLCKRVILLKNGQMVKDGSVDAVIPLYQNIVLEKEEEDFREGLAKDTRKVRLDQKTLISIDGVKITNSRQEHKDCFTTGEPIILTLRYNSGEHIDSPIFFIEIVRSDGVTCCASNSQESGLTLKTVKGQGALKIDLSRMNLAAGVYMARLSIWDKDMLNPFVTRDEDVIRIVDHARVRYVETVFLPEIGWENLE
jgi:lipopolysaccharide transport system ATP-binding protein